MKIYICGYEVTTEELRADVQAAKAEGLSRRFAFFPETVEALLDLLDLYAQQNQDNADKNKRLRKANRKQWELVIRSERREQVLRDALEKIIAWDRTPRLGDRTLFKSFAATALTLAATEETKK